MTLGILLITDHMVRARREVEIPLLQKQWEQIQLEQQKEWEAYLKVLFFFFTLNTI
jgi:hypothetical protein